MPCFRPCPDLTLRPLGLKLPLCAGLLALLLMTVPEPGCSSEPEVSPVQQQRGPGASSLAASGRPEMVNVVWASPAATQPLVGSQLSLQSVTRPGLCLFLAWEVLLAGSRLVLRGVDMAGSYSQLPRGSERQDPHPEDADGCSSTLPSLLNASSSTHDAHVWRRGSKNSVVLLKVR